MRVEKGTIYVCAVPRRYVPRLFVQETDQRSWLTISIAGQVAKGVGSGSSKVLGL